jgi:uncharacterized protein YbaP (TraB family)
MRRLALAAILALILAPAAALALPPVWVVRDKDSTVTLFGSVHLLPPGVDWRPPALKSALARADDVWFEAPMDAAGLAAATEAAQAHSTLPEARRLSGMLTRKGRQRLTAAAERFGLPLDGFERMQPWYAELVLQQAVLKSLGAEQSEGVELQLWSGLPATAKRVSLETGPEQVGFFAGAPLAEQLASLEQTLDEAQHAEKDYKLLLDAWLAGDVKGLDQREVQPLRKAAPGLYARVVQQRNDRWTRALVARLKGSGRTVVVVGMGHLVGADGLPAQLRARGYDVEGP